MSVDYDVTSAFKRIENELIDSMMGRLAYHRAEEMKEGFNWDQWQVLQLKELEKYRLENPAKFAKDFSDINSKVESAFTLTNNLSYAQSEAKILDQIRKGKIKDTSKGAVEAGFFGLNQNRMAHLIQSTKQDFVRGEWSMLRKANDQYRKIIFDAQMYAGTGATYAQAVDMATKDFLKNGIQCITYKNGSVHNITEYASMAIRTGQKRAYLMGEGDALDKYGIHTVRVNKRVDACPLCMKWSDKVLVDDVYAGGTPEEADKLGVPLLSEAIDEGFLHPNCRDVYTMYIPGVSEKPEPWTKKEMEEIADHYNEEQALHRAEDMTESYNRMAEYSLDPANKETYQARADAWQSRVDALKQPEMVDLDLAEPSIAVGDIYSTLAEAGIVEEPEPPSILTATTSSGKTISSKPLAGQTTGKAVPFEKKLNPSYEDYKNHILTLEKAKTDDAVMKPLYEKALVKAEEKITEMQSAGIYKTKIMPVFKQKKKFQTKLDVMDMKQELKVLEQAKTSAVDAKLVGMPYNHTYTGIWKDPVKLSEFDVYGPKVQSKIDYYTDKIYEWQTKGVAEYGKTQQFVDSKIAELQTGLDDVVKYQAEGADYTNKVKAFDDAIKKAEADIEAKKDEILKLENPKEWKKQHGMASSGDFGTIDQARRDNALWAKSPREADDALRQRTGEVWQKASQAEKQAIYRYTSSYSMFNEPLRGIEYGTNRKLGVGKTDLNAGARKNGKRLNAMTDIIEKTSYDQDMWFQRGVAYRGMDDFFAVSEDLLRHGTEQELQNALLGKEVTDYGFFSMGSSKGQGFSSNPIIMNIFTPKGTKMMYAEPFSAFGHGDDLAWNGISKQSSFGHELETILQQGTHFRIIKVERSGSGTIYIDMDVIGQGPVQKYKK